jgi:hypothetical protein
MKTIAMVMAAAALGALASPVFAQQRIAARDTTKLLSYPIPPPSRQVSITKSLL